MWLVTEDRRYFSVAVVGDELIAQSSDRGQCNDLQLVTLNHNPRRTNAQSNIEIWMQRHLTWTTLSSQQLFLPERSRVGRRASSSPVPLPASACQTRPPRSPLRSPAHAVKRNAEHEAYCGATTGVGEEQAKSRCTLRWWPMRRRSYHRATNWDARKWDVDWGSISDSICRKPQTQQKRKNHSKYTISSSSLSNCHN